MPSSFAHAAVGLAVAAAAGPSPTKRRVAVLAAACAVLPDIDYLGAPFGWHGYDAWFGGHRGFTHSLTFGALVAMAITWTAFRDARWDGLRLRLWACLALATASHGVLDALTTNGPGVAFLSPFSGERFTTLWHPIDPRGAATGLRGFARLAGVLANEALWVLLPSALVIALMRSLDRNREASSASA